MTDKNDFNDIPTDDLLELLGATYDGIVAGTERAAKILVVLMSRGVTHPLMSEGVLRYFREIESGRLSAAAAVAFAGNRNMVGRIVGLPREIQVKIALGETLLEVAEFTPRGEIVVQKRPIRQLDNPTLDRVFAKERIRTPKEQETLLRAAQASVAAPSRQVGQRVSIASDSKALMIGRSRIEPNELMGPLLRLGFKLVRVTEKERVSA